MTTPAQHATTLASLAAQFKAGSITQSAYATALTTALEAYDDTGALAEAVRALMASNETILDSLQLFTPDGSVDLVGDLPSDADPGAFWLVTTGEFQGHGYLRVGSTWEDLGQLRGASAYQVWLAQPGNAGLTEADYLDWLAAAQVAAVEAQVQPLVDAAAGSATSAAGSATTATTKAGEASDDAAAAETARAAAAVAKAAAETARDAAAGSATAAAGSATTATTKAGEAAASATAAAGSATAAAGSATTATTKAGEASDDAAAAAGSATAAAGSATTATTKAGEAAASATAAAGSATAAAGSATTATTKAGEASDDAAAAETARAAAVVAQTAAEAARDDAVAIVGSDFITKAGGSSASGKVAVFSNADGSTVAARAIGATSATDILDRQSGDARYRSEAQVTTAITGAIDALVAGAPGALDTLNELAAALAADDDAIAALTTSLAGKAAASHTHAISDVTGLATALDARVQTVNGVGPDGSGNVAVATGGASSRDLARHALAIAELRGTRLPGSAGWSDSFGDTTGVDAAASSNEAYDAADDLYANAFTPGATASNLVPDMTSNTAPSGVASASSEIFSSAAWFGFDRDFSHWYANMPGAWLRYDFGEAKTAVVYKMHLGNNQPSAWRLRGSNDASSWTTLDTVVDNTFDSDQNTPISFNIDAPAPYRYYEVCIDAVHGGGSAGLRGLELWSATTADVYSAMDLRSVGGALSSVPTSASLVVIAKGASAITPGTHLTGYVSRDDGANWQDMSLAAAETDSAGWTVFEAYGVSLASQPSGDDLRWRVTTTDDFLVEVAGVFVGVEV